MTEGTKEMKKAICDLTNSMHDAKKIYKSEYHLVPHQVWDSFIRAVAVFMTDTSSDDELNEERKVKKSKEPTIDERSKKIAELAAPIPETPILFYGHVERKGDEHDGLHVYEVRDALGDLWLITAKRMK